MRVASTPHRVAIAIKRAKPRLIGIDGTDGAGKSRLARSLGRRLAIRVVHLDELLRKRQGVYVKALRLSALNASLALSQRSIVEGVCLLKALGRLRRTPDFLIYVKRVRHERWIDEDDLDPPEGIEAHLTGMRQAVRRLGGSGSLGVSEEIMRYHSEPHRVSRRPVGLSQTGLV